MLISERMREGQLEMRKADDAIYQRLLQRGYTAVRAKDPSEWWQAGRALRRRLSGRIYSEALVDQAERIALQYADEEQRAQWARPQ
jgi:hypothetical protein